MGGGAAAAKAVWLEPSTQTLLVLLPLLVLVKLRLGQSVVWLGAVWER
jgi:hypothetical protein